MDKLRIWNYVTMFDSSLQYAISSEYDMSLTMHNRLSSARDALTDEEAAWIWFNSSKNSGYNDQDILNLILKIQDIGVIH
jgi:hypothetical protein